MSLSPIKVAVVGHTNTGKTSLLRTLTRDAEFGEVSYSPSTTRHVEGTALLVNARTIIELYDTPGLEDSIGLLDELDRLVEGKRVDGRALLHKFLNSNLAKREFEQEAKVLRQVLASDLALYVIDARDQLHGKFRDELTILAYTARPVMPVLNFVASEDAKLDKWRDYLARINLHAIVDFDTVVFDHKGERRLLEKMQTLLDHHYGLLQLLIDDREAQWDSQKITAAKLLAELLIDVTAYRIRISSKDERQQQSSSELLKETTCRHEQRCINDLLRLFRFSPEDFEAGVLSATEGKWERNLFDPETLKEFGISVGGSAAKGGMIGLMVDLFSGGMSLGAATALGAGIGAVWGGTREYGQKMVDQVRGYSELCVANATIGLLALRQIQLIRALLRRGHASQTKIAVESTDNPSIWHKGELPNELKQARYHPEWSKLSSRRRLAFSEDERRNRVIDTLSQRLLSQF